MERETIRRLVQEHLTVDPRTGTNVGWARIEALLAAALDTPTEARQSFLDTACASDPRLRGEVAALLAASERPGPIDSPVAALTSWLADLEKELTRQLDAGSRLGPYVIVAPLGAGGMGEVYRARDARLDRDVAIKIVASCRRPDAASRIRLEREARIVASMSHTNIMAVYDIGEQDGQMYVVTELLTGRTLRQMLQSGPLEESAVLDLAVQMARGLSAAHARLIVHRDFKPENVFVTEEGVLKILDFGLAQPRCDDADPTTIAWSATRAVAGTVAYMSPEQARGEPVDHRSDLWSLGVVLHEMSAGTRPFDGETMPEVVDAPLTTAVPARTRNPRIGAGLARIIARLLEKDRSARYQSTNEVRVELERLERQARPGSHSMDPRSRRWWPAAGVALATAAAFIVAYGRSSTSPSPLISPSKYVQLTTFSDSAEAPAFSPNGDAITFVRGGAAFLSTGQIWVKSLIDGQSRSLTAHDGLKYAPAFTPDGAGIAYTLVENPANALAWDTWIVPVRGGDPIRRLPNASALVWTDDRHVLYSEVKGTGLHMGLVTSTQTGAGRREIYFPAHERAMAHYSWPSPDRRWVLLVEMGPDLSWQRCRIVPFDGSSPGREVGPTGGCTSAGWSPDGEWMYFSASVNGASHLWRQRFPDGKPEQLTSGPTEEDGVAVAPDGRSIVTSVGVRRSSIWLQDATTGNREISVEGWAVAPLLSRDGQRVYYVLQRDSMSPVRELVVLDLSSGRSESVWRGTAIIDYEISPDERELALTRRTDGGELEIWLAPLDRRTPPRVIAHGGRWVSFGPDDDLFFVALEDRANFLWRIGKDGSGRERMSDIPILNKFGVSPDGNWIVATVPGESLSSVPGGRETGGPRTFALPTRGGSPELLCAHVCDARWSADGRLLYLAPVALQGRRTLVLPVPTGQPLPDVPPDGLSIIGLTRDGIGLPGERVLEHRGVVPSVDPSRYVFVDTGRQSNLFRIPLP